VLITKQSMTASCLDSRMNVPLLTVEGKKKIIILFLKIWII